MDANQSLTDTENALRDFIACQLQANFGDDWPAQCGVTAERLEKWKERREQERKKHKRSSIDERLIYYADFYDLRTILKKHWADCFAAALGDWKEIEIFLKALETYRDTLAHRRTLLPHQEHLITGIEGEIRTRLVQFRNRIESIDDYFPRIESAMDNLGNSITTSQMPTMITDVVLRPGDRLEFVINAVDPLGRPLEYSVDGLRDIAMDKWTSSKKLSVVISEKDIGKNCMVRLRIRSDGEYHAHDRFDDWVQFFYTVLPATL